MPRKPRGSKRKPKTEYKIYKGVRCVLTIIPKKITEVADLVPGDYVSFEYDSEKDEIILRPTRKRAHANR